MEWALDHAARGFCVFPLKPNGKRPGIKGWPELATTDPATIRDWWDRWPEANIGIATAGLLVVDIDDKAGRCGGVTWLELCLEHCGPIDTLTARTASGGRHLYFRPSRPVGNSAGRLGDGLDVRGAGGYVVAPGSTIDGREYEWKTVAEIADAPQWLLDLAGAAPEPRERECEPLVEPDTPSALRRAQGWLETTEPAIEGAGGDHHTFTVAAQLRDYGISEPMALDLMLDHWNERCAPPWMPEDLERKVANAFRYAQNAPGVASPAVDFGEPVETPALERLLKPYRWRDERNLPLRPWIYGNLLMRGTVSALVAPPGASKSTFSLASAIAIATGRPLLDIDVHESTRVAVWNNEDPAVELERRTLAALRQFDIDPAELEPDGVPRLFLQSGEDRIFRIARRVSVQGGGYVLQPADLEPVRDELIANSIGVLVVDPFLETHPAAENDNAEVGQVAQLYRRLAQQANCAVLLIHHTRKPSNASAASLAGDLDTGRGASALMGVIRQGATLYTMTQKEAGEYGVDPSERYRYARYDEGKANMALLSGRPRWFRRESVRLATWHSGPGEPEAIDKATGRGLSFESVGTLAPVALQPVKAVGRSAERDVLLGAAAEVLLDQGPLPFSDLAEALARLPMFEAEEAGKLRRRLERRLPDDHLVWNGYEFQTEARDLGRRGSRNVKVVSCHRLDGEDEARRDN
ncbi:bifunctional DNA primase/polymerase [Minwuia thermotolerans]|uniref:DNA primase/polymerase bifunctional N-terminal domain-containing protein n=1 Tax=Minwuia thermotolerans TaxID=2056226 RepID=A0A2M9G2E2_9PROT|nr:bifunctional DNA primase/polymerase [Minwuia thermotolerans]PJK29892.1 hypothetical protein CVT23_08945 [Minwuia thermotolerans]